MDLYATGQMKDNNLDKVLEEQGIKIPSIRGVRIMADAYNEIVYMLNCFALSCKNGVE